MWFENLHYFRKHQMCKFARNILRLREEETFKRSDFRRLPVFSRLHMLSTNSSFLVDIVFSTSNTKRPLTFYNIGLLQHKHSNLYQMNNYFIA